jgi:hypothetical protein
MAQRVVAVRNAVKARADGHCEICGIKLLRPEGHNIGSMHHRFKKEYGGLDSLANLLHLCMPCHRWVHDDEYESFIDWGYVCDYPETTPCNVFGLGWAMLEPTGKLMPVSNVYAHHLLAEMKTLADYRRDQASLTLERQREKMRALMIKTGRTRSQPRERYYHAVIMSTLSC